MSRSDPEPGRTQRPSLFCDLTQSWSEVGGGVRTYLLHKRRHILEATRHRHLLIVPGDRDQVIEEDRAITVTIASPHVPGSPHYRLMLRNGAVRQALKRFQPDLIECQDAYNLPWAAIAHRRGHPDTALIAGRCIAGSMRFSRSVRMAEQPSSRASALARSMSCRLE
jgi:alpha-1,6-mannosyltransferase